MGRHENLLRALRSNPDAPTGLRRYCKARTANKAQQRVRHPGRLRGCQRCHDLLQNFGHGKPLVLAHGGPGASHDYFLPYLAPLARHYQLVFIDERGSGRSPALENVSAYTVENMVEDVEAVRQGLSLGRISLLGHSYGGVLAQAYALKYQKNLSHLILASTFSSTGAINEVFVHMKEKMPADLRDRINRMESDGLYGHGKDYEKNRYTTEYMTAALGRRIFSLPLPQSPRPKL
jgi:proline-specific peptidase